MSIWSACNHNEKGYSPPLRRSCMLRKRESVTEPILQLESHPFFVGPVTSSSQAAYLTLPFHLGIDLKFAMPVQIVSDEIIQILDNTYSMGSMLSTPLGHSALSLGRLDEMLSILLSQFRGNVKDSKFLEIGCGSGDLLNELKIRGASVMGVEIGPQGNEGASKYGFPVIDKPFAPGLIHEKFDCIFSYGCLEHVTDLEDIFIAGRECLKEGGLFFHAVPNSEQFFSQATFDNLYHEHINYFGSENGARLFDFQGFQRTQHCTSDAGNDLYLWGYYDEKSVLRWPGDDPRIILEESDTLRRYARMLSENTARITAVLNTILSAGESVGFYAGGFEYGVIVGNTGSIRYFDGDSYKHGAAWLPGLTPIESPHELKSNPVDHLIICKEHYFNAILKYLSNDVNIPADITIYSLRSLLRNH
jgi:SAM-dependent methyltransferase